MAYRSSGTSGPGIKVELNAKQLAAFRKRVERWQGAPLAIRASKGTLKAADYVAAMMKRAAPVSTKYAVATRRVRDDKPGGLRKSIRVRKGRRGLFTDAFVGPTAPHKFLVTRGTERHSLAPVKAGAGNFMLMPPLGRGGKGAGLRNVRTASGVTHPGAQPNPFVDETARAHHGDAVNLINQILFSE